MQPAILIRSLVIAAVVVGLVGCAAADETDGGAASEPGQPSSASADATAPEGIPTGVWNDVLADVSQRVDEQVVDPTVVTAEAVTWDDGAWGCPQEGELYTQALVPGYQVVIEVDGEEFDYRSDGRSIRLCDPASVPESDG